MDRRSVVWISLESIRYDHTSLGASDRETTPFLRRLAAGENTASFAHCFSHDIWTRSSTASILTGHAPSEHRTWTADAGLPSTVRTIPERFSAAGYHTVGVSPNAQFSAATGLDRGFDDFHYVSGKRELLREAGPRICLQYLLNLHRHSAGFTTDTRRHSLGYVNAAISRRHLRAAGREDGPVFLYTHLGDSHHPYYPPKPWQDRFAPDLEDTVPVSAALETALEMSARLHEHIAEGLPFSPAEWRSIEAMYATGLAYVDHVAEQIVETAGRTLEDPIVVVTGDHGEFLGERGLLAHMLGTDTAVTRVPLVVSGLDAVETIDPSADLVQHADVMQMICNACGVDADLSVGRDISVDPRTFAVTQRSGARASTKLATIAEHNPAFDDSGFHEGDLTTLTTTSYRYDRSPSGAGLYALPDESTDVSESDADARDRFEDWTDEWLGHRREQAGSTRPVEFSAEMEQRLEDMGYL